uniref:ATP synthase F0 subunit 8 n=1 Tax=Nymphon gracile TaxID=136195 RepID=A0MG52_NYMGR|nr:ATP synthase F0 subunit 8 [Nymphon gracile]ABF93284.1 ATP synthase F0 subunit 8 [Nymphon gracile]
MNKIYLTNTYLIIITFIPLIIYFMSNTFNFMNTMKIKNNKMNNKYKIKNLKW